MKHHYPVRALSLLCALAIFVSLIPAVSAAVSKDVLENNTITDAVTPAGVQINLFDYWVTERTAVDNGIQWTEATGINKGHDLRFMANGDRNNDGIRINQYTGSNGGVRSGIVQDRLSGGYPVLTPGNKTGLNENGGLSRAQSLDYLFDKSEEINKNGSKSGTLGKKTFWDVRGLLQVDDDGYYYFNADHNKAGEGKSYETANYACFDEKANAFTIPGASKKWATVTSKGSSSPSIAHPPSTFLERTAASWCRIRESARNILTSTTCSASP